MSLRRWEDLPDFMRVPEVRPYWESLYRKRFQLGIKRIFDVVVASLLLIILAIPMIIIAVMIKKDSKGPVFYRLVGGGYDFVFYVVDTAEQIDDFARFDILI